MAPSSGIVAMRSGLLGTALPVGWVAGTVLAAAMVNSLCQGELRNFSSRKVVCVAPGCLTTAALPGAVSVGVPASQNQEERPDRDSNAGPTA
jgi:hypothetical protein